MWDAASTASSSQLARVLSRPGWSLSSCLILSKSTCATLTNWLTRVHGRPLRSSRLTGLPWRSLLVAPAVPGDLDLAGVFGPRAAVDQHFDDLLVAARGGDLERGAAVAGAGVGVGCVDEQGLGHGRRRASWSGRSMAASRGLSGPALSSAPRLCSRHHHRGLAGGGGVVEGRAAVGGAGAGESGVGVEEFGGARDVAGGGGLEDVGFGGLRVQGGGRR